MSEQPDSLWSGSYLNAATSRMIEGQIPFPHPSSHSLSVSISRTTKGIPLFVVFICSMFHPQAVIICPQLSSQEKDAEWTFISITGKVDPGKRGGLFSVIQPHVTLFWLSLAIHHCLSPFPQIHPPLPSSGSFPSIFPLCPIILHLADPYHCCFHPFYVSCTGQVYLPHMALG